MHSWWSAYHVLLRRVAYQELGADYLDQAHRAARIRYHFRRLRELGVVVWPAHAHSQP